MKKLITPQNIPPLEVPANSMLPLLGRIVQELSFRSHHTLGLQDNASLVLCHLKAHPDVCQPAAIADAIRLPRQTATFVLDTLEKKGLATRAPHDHDRRRKVVHLTAKGHRLAEAHILDLLQVEQEAVAAIGHRDLAMFRKILVGFVEFVSQRNARDFKSEKG